MDQERSKKNNFEPLAIWKIQQYYGFSIICLENMMVQFSYTSRMAQKKKLISERSQELWSSAGVLEQDSFSHPAKACSSSHRKIQKLSKPCKFAMIGENFCNIRNIQLEQSQSELSFPVRSDPKMKGSKQLNFAVRIITETTHMPHTKELLRSNMQFSCPKTRRYFKASIEKHCLRTPMCLEG